MILDSCDKTKKKKKTFLNIDTKGFDMQLINVIQNRKKIHQCNLCESLTRKNKNRRRIINRQKIENGYYKI